MVRLAKSLLLLVIACLLIVAGVNIVVVRGGAGYKDDSRAVAAAPAAIVLGARVYPDGVLSPMLRDRMSAALSLYDRGRVSCC